jgi:hypothetical protein
MSAPDADWWPLKWEPPTPASYPHAFVHINGHRLHVVDERRHPPPYGIQVYVRDSRGVRVDDLLSLRAWLIDFAAKTNPTDSGNPQE